MAFVLNSRTVESILLDLAQRSVFGEIAQNRIRFVDPTTGLEVLKGWRIMGVNIDETAETYDHPLENGSEITDHRIVKPVEITVDAVTRRGTARMMQDYNELFDIFTSGKQLTIYTRARLYPNMLSQGIPHDESSDKYDVLQAALAFKQVFVAPSATGKLTTNQVLFPEDSSTKSSGTTSGSRPGATPSFVPGFLDQ